MLAEILKKPQILLPKKHIILISHMRANTSLLGHIFGSHPSISGYYEHHIGYYSWKSLIREKLKFSQENPNEAITKIYFDKILHTKHHISDDIYKRKDVFMFFMLRRPERTIKSIVKLFQRVEPSNEYAAIDFATEYYIERVEDIAKMAKKYAENREVYYLDSEAIVDKTEEALELMSSWYQLKPKLNSEYKLFDLSGKRKVGDSSAQIKNGYIKKNEENYNDVEIDTELLQRAEVAYQNSKKIILSLSASSIVA